MQSFHKKIRIFETKDKGRGIIATKKIKKKEIIEYCPLIILGKKDSQFIENKKKSDTLYYYYLQQPEWKRNSIILGYGSLYNHSLTPNAEIGYKDNKKSTQVFFRAIKDIKAGEEITWDYNFEKSKEEFLPIKKRRK